MSGSPVSRLNPDRLQLAFDLLREAVSGGELPVGLLSVADRRETLRSEAYGPDGRVGTDGIYPIASITKPIVATAVMQLVERGRLLLEDPVVRYVPEFGVNGKDRVTVWHLLTHSSGLDHDYWQRGSFPRTAEEDLQDACAAGLRFQPGSLFEYCNASFRVLGEILHRCSGQPYQEYLRQQLLVPAGMVDTSFNPEPEKRSRVLPVHGFPEIPGGMEAFAALAMPSGGLFSTSADLVAFGQAFLNGGMGGFGRLLGPAALRVMTSLHTQGLFSLREGLSVPQYWGISWEKASPAEGRLLSPSGFGHGGMTGGYLWIDPEAGLVILFLTNRVGLDGRTRKRIVNAVLGALE